MRHADAISAAFENEMMVQEEIKAELAELRKKESTSQMLQSGLIIVTGAVAIIATAGAATPIVIEDSLQVLLRWHTGSPILKKQSTATA